MTDSTSEPLQVEFDRLIGILGGHDGPMWEALRLYSIEIVQQNAGGGRLSDDHPITVEQKQRFLHYVDLTAEEKLAFSLGTAVHLGRTCHLMMDITTAHRARQP